MNLFQEAFSVTAAIAIVIVGSVILLTLFFHVLAWSISNVEQVAVRGVLGKETWVAVHLHGNKKLERVRILGYQNVTASNDNMQFPYALSSMVILEDEAEKKFLIRAKLIQMIVIEPEDKAEKI